MANPTSRINENVGLKSVTTNTIKIYCYHVFPNFGSPWQQHPQEASTSSGFVVDITAGGTEENLMVMCNAHGISFGTNILVRRHGHSQRFPARIAHVSHEADLALLSVADEAFWKDLSPLSIADSIPNLQDRIFVCGYPLGGDNLSITEGVISRIDICDYAYSNESYLTLQIDAPINGGNSGGPALIKVENEDGKSQWIVAGVAFESLDQAENIGYVIATPVIKHFLENISREGGYTGFPDLNMLVQHMENKAFRSYHRVPDLSAIVELMFPKAIKTLRDSVCVKNTLLSQENTPIIEILDSTTISPEQLEVDDVTIGGKKMKDVHKKAQEEYITQDQADKQLEEDKDKKVLPKNTLPSAYGPVVPVKLGNQTYFIHHDLMSIEDRVDMALIDNDDMTALPAPGKIDPVDIINDPLCCDILQLEDPAPDVDVVMPSVLKEFILNQDSNNFMGVCVDVLAKFTSVNENLVQGDVILAWDDVPIGNNATIRFRDRERVQFSYIATTKYVGDEARLLILRNKKYIIEVKPLMERKVRIVKTHIFEPNPSYFVFMGMVFVVLSGSLLQNTYGDQWVSRAPVSLTYNFSGVGNRSMSRGDEEVVIVNSLLMHDSNLGYDFSSVRIVSVNDEPVVNLKHLATMVGDYVEKGYQEFKDTVAEQTVLYNAKKASEGEEKTNEMCDIEQVSLTPSLPSLQSSINDDIRTSVSDNDGFDFTKFDKELQDAINAIVTPHRYLRIRASTSEIVIDIFDCKKKHRQILAEHKINDSGASDDVRAAWGNPALSYYIKDYDVFGKRIVVPDSDDVISNGDVDTSVGGEKRKFDGDSNSEDNTAKKAKV